jgi:hypothetical protein
LEALLAGLTLLWIRWLPNASRAARSKSANSSSSVLVNRTP